MALRKLVKLITPPLFLDLGRTLRRALPAGRPEWEYVPQGWSAQKADPRIRGWNVASVLEAYQAKWPEFVRQLEGVGPFGASPEAPSPGEVDLHFHNAIMVYAYALALAARRRAVLSMLDWGGGIGHYFLISRALIPDQDIDYHCKDVALLAGHGQALFPQAHFYADESCLDRRYDFVVASGSLHYSEDWGDVLAGLARATDGYLLVTHLPVVENAPSFVFVQRPYPYGYATEYLGWCLNQAEFLNRAAAVGLTLTRIFSLGYRPPIHRAPAQNEYRAYLFLSARTAGGAAS